MLENHKAVTFFFGVLGGVVECLHLFYRAVYIIRGEFEKALNNDFSD